MRIICLFMIQPLIIVGPFDPAPIDSVQEFIEYLQIKIFDLECKVK